MLAVEEAFSSIMQNSQALFSDDALGHAIGSVPQRLQQKTVSEAKPFDKGHKSPACMGSRNLNRSNTRLGNYTTGLIGINEPFSEILRGPFRALQFKMRAAVETHLPIR